MYMCDISTLIVLLKTSNKIWYVLCIYYVYLCSLLGIELWLIVDSVAEIYVYVYICQTTVCTYMCKWIHIWRICNMLFIHCLTSVLINTHIPVSAYVSRQLIKYNMFFVCSLSGVELWLLVNRLVLIYMYMYLW